MKMKATTIVLGLSVTAYFIIYLNGKLVATHTKHKQKILRLREASKGKVTDEHSKVHNKNKKLKHTNNKLKNESHHNKSHVHKSSKNHLKVKQAVKPIIKLSSQMAAAKKVCWNKKKMGHKIVNGTDPKPTSLPWMVAIFREINLVYKDTRYLCGGSLISSGFVLSAGHCFLNITKQWTIAKYYMLSVRLGMHDLSSKSFVLSGVDNIYIHHDYYTIKKGSFSDIALIKLKKIITYSDVIQPICVPHLSTPTSWNKLKKQKSVLVSGWGTVAADTAASLTLQKGYASIENQDVCRRFVDLYNRSTTFCIGKHSYTSKVCQGDSGSPVIPLITINKNATKILPVVIGLVSFGDPSCLGPDVLTKVESFIDWINYWTS